MVHPAAPVGPQAAATHGQSARAVPHRPRPVRPFLPVRSADRPANSRATVGGPHPPGAAHRELLLRCRSTSSPAASDSTTAPRDQPRPSLGATYLSARSRGVPRLPALRPTPRDATPEAAPTGWICRRPTRPQSRHVLPRQCSDRSLQEWCVPQHERLPHVVQWSLFASRRRGLTRSLWCRRVPRNYAPQTVRRVHLAAPASAAWRCAATDTGAPLARSLLRAPGYSTPNTPAARLH